MPPAADIGRHTHSLDNEEIYIVISGHGLMCLDDHEFAVGPGHVIINRPGGTHALKNTGNTDLRLIVIEVPVCDKPADSVSS
jgi:mannose-6-phosphate isomerase-like protein (cupin superfamily)